MDNIREFKGLSAKIVKAFAVAVTFFGIIYVLDIFWLFDLFVYAEAYRAAMSGLVLVLVFLYYPATKKGPFDRVPWYDYILCLLSLPGTFYLFIFYGDVVVRGVYATTAEVVLGLITVAVFLEASRRTVGSVITAIGFLFFIYPLISGHLPGILMGKSHGLPRLIGLSYLFSEGIFGIIIGVVFTVLVVYILFAQLLTVSGAGNVIIDSAYSLLGNVRGGPAKVSILASGAFGMISGSVPSNVMSTGMITIPLMKRTGFSPYYAGAVEAVASTGGGLTPPVMGSVAFIMAEFLGIGYGDVVIAAAVPALFYYYSLFLQIDCQAAKRGFKGLDRRELPSLSKTIKNGWPFFIPLIVLVLFLIVFRYSATTAGLYSLGVLIAVTQLKKENRINLAKIMEAFHSTAKILAFLVPVCGVAGIIIACINLTGLGIRLSQLLITISGGHALVLLLLAAIVNFILGMGLPTQACYLLLAILVVPSLIKGGLDPLASHLFVLWTGQLAYITPPVCIGAYAASAIAGSDPVRTGFQAMRLGIVAYIIPFAFVLNTNLLLNGTIKGAILTFVLSTAGISALAFGLEGYFLKKEINLPLRSLFVLFGFILLFGYSWWFHNAF